MTEELPPPLDPNPGEIDCLSVLWQAHEEGYQSLRLSEIHDRIRKRREAFGESPPAPTTVSTYLRSAVSKRLLEEVRQGPGHVAIPLHAVRSRGALASSRSPQTAYRAVFLPSVVFRNTFAALIQAYPPKLRYEAVVDFAREAHLNQCSLDERFLILFKLFALMRFDELPIRDRNSILRVMIQSLGLDHCYPTPSPEKDPDPIVPDEDLVQELPLVSRRSRRPRHSPALPRSPVNTG